MSGMGTTAHALSSKKKKNLYSSAELRKIQGKYSNFLSLGHSHL